MYPQSVFFRRCYCSIIDRISADSLIDEPDAHPGGGLWVGAAVLGVTVGAALVVGSFVPVLGAPAAALLLGMAIRLRWQPDSDARGLLRFTSKKVLQAAIVLLGATFGLGSIASIGRDSLPLMLGTIGAALAVAWVGGRIMRVEGTLTTLIGVGTAICGASAIGAVSGIVVATESQIAYAVATIFVFNVAAVVLFPLVGHALDLSQYAFGLWCGTAVNDTSSVVAAAYGYGHESGDVAVVTKLARTTMIIPIALTLAALQIRHRRRRGEERSLRQIVPLFLVLFVVAAALNSAGLIPDGAKHELARTAVLIITAALAAVGLSTRLADLRPTGLRPLALGAIVWGVVAVSGLVLQHSL